MNKKAFKRLKRRADSHDKLSCPPRMREKASDIKSLMRAPRSNGLQKGPPAGTLSLT